MKSEGERGKERKREEKREKEKKKREREKDERSRARTYNPQIRSLMRFQLRHTPITRRRIERVKKSRGRGKERRKS